MTYISVFDGITFKQVGVSVTYYDVKLKYFSLLASIMGNDLSKKMTNSVGWSPSLTFEGHYPPLPSSVQQTELYQCVNESHTILSTLSTTGNLCLSLLTPFAHDELIHIVRMLVNVTQKMERTLSIFENVLKKTIRNESARTSLVDISAKIVAINRTFKHIHENRLSHENLMTEAISAKLMCREVAQLFRNKQDLLDDTVGIRAGGLLTVFCSSYCAILQSVSSYDSQYDYEKSEAKGMMIELLEKFKNR